MNQMTLSSEEAALLAVQDQRLDAVVQSSSLSVQLCAAIMQGEHALAAAANVKFNWLTVIISMILLTVTMWMSAF